jgi:biotin-(acetyl-CoA carboxylase) ligase
MLAGIETRYDHLRAGQSPHDEWMARLVTLGQVVHATTPTGVLVGLAEKVDRAGALLLRTADGGVHRLTSGDVTLRSGDS